MAGSEGFKPAIQPASQPFRYACPEAHPYLANWLSDAHTGRFPFFMKPRNKQPGLSRQPERHICAGDDAEKHGKHLTIAQVVFEEPFREYGDDYCDGSM